MEDENKKPVKADWLTQYDLVSYLGIKIQNKIEEYVRSLNRENYSILEDKEEINKVEIENILDMTGVDFVDDLATITSRHIIDRFDECKKKVIILKKGNEFVPKLRDGVYPSAPDDYVGD